MKFKKLIKKLNDVPSSTPVKFYYEGLKGDFYMDKANNIMFVKAGETEKSYYTFSLDDFNRKDWQITIR